MGKDEDAMRKRIKFKTRKTAKATNSGTSRKPVPIRLEGDERQHEQKNDGLQHGAIVFTMMERSYH